MTAGAACFHCGEPLPARGTRTVTLGGTQRQVCCPGCEAASRLIDGAGLSDFYRFREGSGARPSHSPADEWTAFDRSGAQQDLVRSLTDGRREIALIVEGLYCAACGWLIERALLALEGVAEVQLNPATGRALVRWDPTAVSLSTVLRRIATLGYRPSPALAGEAAAAATRERHAALKRLAVAGLGMMQVMMYAVGLYAGAIHAGMDPAVERFLRLVSLIVATPVVVYAGAPFFRGAWRDLRARSPGMDVPIALAVGGAYAASTLNTLRGAGEVYFDSATMFVFFLTVARFLEMSARHRAGAATDALATGLPATALRLEDGAAVQVTTGELATGDRVRVRAGEAVPADGRIVAGSGAVDESMLTGESVPRPKAGGDELVAGSVLTSGMLEIRVASTGASTLLSHLARQHIRAQSERPRLATAADWVARRFVVGVLVAATVAGVAWWLIEPGSAFAVTLAVLVVTCPCALSLATPATLVAAGSRLARRGVMVGTSAALETLAGVTHVVLDKTGTVTQGRAELRRIEVLGELTDRQCLAQAAALAACSEHPLARAFDGAVPSPPAARDLRTEPGHGVEAHIDGRLLRFGRGDWVAALSDSQAPRHGEDTRVALGDRTGVLAVFHLADPLRPDAREALATLIERGLRVELASGDHAAAVARTARELDLAQWHADMTPEAKLTRVRALQAGGARVAVVGDGVNDAPVLGGADVAIAMGGGTAMAQSGADFVLTAERLTDIPGTHRLARRAMRIVRQNLVWAVTYNLLALPLAAGGLLAPWAAALGMSASSLLVVGNALRLGRTPRRSAERVPATTAARPAERTASAAT